MSVTADTYQGWTNRETWCVALWLNNEQGLQEGARDACNTDGEMEHEAAQTLEHYVDDLVESQLASVRDRMVADLIKCCLARVNWGEIVQTFRD